MGHDRKSEGLRSLYPRQGRFWYALGARQSMGALQWAGLIALFAFYSAVLAVLLLLRWPSGPGSWHDKAIHAYGLYLAVWGVIVFAILGANWAARRRKRSRPLPKVH
jgi:hypothetical protein